ncbi:DUF4157 domain-containing protein [Streptomyces sp. NBC_01386]|uniref:eCIS core domain-containing protein n=1 Tax=Streptomyces sp. NBC_01386 TaxID=2903848 RepID=UPI00324CAC29
MSHHTPEPERARRADRGRHPDEVQADRAAAEAMAGVPVRAVGLAGLPEPAEAGRRTGAPGLTRSGGAPLEAGTRGAMEAGFGHDFSRVRVHDDGAADRAARAEGAAAFTVGEHIFFRGGRRAPGSDRGNRLLAHELAHVAQQRAEGTVLVQRQEELDDGPEAEEPRPVRMRFAVKVRHPMEPDRLLLEFIKQYRGVATDAEAKELREREHWQWYGTSPRAGPAEAARGEVLITVHDQSLRATSEDEKARLTEGLEGLGEEERKALDAETARLFRERTRMSGPAAPGTAEDKITAEYRAELRYELLRRRAALQALPEDVKAILFASNPKDQGKPLDPRDYARLLALADRLVLLTPQQRDEYLHRSTAPAADLGALEGSLGRFEEELAERRRLDTEQSSLELRLTGRERLYGRYRQLVVQEALAPLGGLLLTPYGIKVQEESRAAQRKQLDEDLKAEGFAGIGEFAGLVRSYASVFRAQSLALAEVLMDRWDHELVQQEKLLLTTPVAAEVHQRLGPAREAFKNADLLGLTPATRDSAKAKRDEAEELVRKEAGDLTVLKQQSFDRKAFAEATPEEARRTTRAYIVDRRADVARARRLLKENPDRVFSLEALLKHAYTAQGIEKDSVFDSIVRDHARDLSLKDAETQWLAGIVAIGLGLLSGGGGFVGVVAASGAFALSAYQAFEEFRRYEESSALHGAGLLSEDPSIAWAVVALVGAGLDLAAVGTALKAVGKEGVSLGKAAATFNETRDMARLSKEVAQADPVVQAAVKKAAEAQKKVWAAWGRILRPGGALYSDFPFMIRAFWGPTLEAIWLTQLYGVRRFQQFLRTREARQLFVADFAKLAPEAQSGVRRMYDEVSRVVQRGESLGLRPDELDHIMLAWADRPGTPVTTVLREMETYGAPLASGRTVRHRIAPESVMDEATRRVLPEFDWRIASTGAIRSIRAHVDRERRLVVVIEGTLGPSLARSSGKARPDQLVAPNFNTGSSLFSVRELGQRGLPNPGEWELLHLWGPGFGDEAAAGIMAGPRVVNQQWQSRGIEKYIRELRDAAREEAGSVHLRATGESWPDPTPTTGFRAPGGVRFFKEAKYEITLLVPGRPRATTTVTIHAAEPPASALAGGGIEIRTPDGRLPADLLGERVRGTP